MGWRLTYGRRATGLSFIKLCSIFLVMLSIPYFSANRKRSTSSARDVLDRECVAIKAQASFHL